MKTIGQIRRDNLELLIAEAGTLEALAVGAGTSSVYLSQIRTQAKDTKTQRPRELGTPMARRLETSREKPPGWMDVEHPVAPTASNWVRPAELSLEELKGRTLGDVALSIANLTAELSSSRRKTLSHLFAAQIADGPDEDEARAIDALAPGLSLATFHGQSAVAKNSKTTNEHEWRATAAILAAKHPNADTRQVLTEFIEHVDSYLAGQAEVRSSIESPPPIARARRT